ncbi:MAG: hypothetical protein CVU03_06810 [Bacteroidetes bacterium HGW-Bacteroidetes-2]|jgi:hypothetical protein|nr:MAG: hypothetical protein CVU03_06810 [Bacteroidetes bacterium HGW-Bacteroidetes-2]
MKEQKNTIAKKILPAILAIALLFPSIINFVHAYSHDKHQHCTEMGTLHFHKKDLDCQLCDFHLTPTILLSFSEETAIITQLFSISFSSYILLFSNYDQLHYNLRGPPAIS